MSNEFFTLNNVDLYAYNSMRIHSNAECLYLPYTIEGLIQLCEKFSSSEEMVIIGKGSNTIFASENYSKPIVCTILLSGIDYIDRKFSTQCGLTLSELAWFAMEKSVCGYEFLEDIPGTVGGALLMNAGTYDDAISQLVDEVVVYDFAYRKVRKLVADELRMSWGKRKSYFQNTDCCILECVLNAEISGNYMEILDKMLETKRKRYVKQPREYPSAGSVFKRPFSEGEPVYVWKLLEQAGLRGYMIGGAQVSQKHPGFIINADNCTGNDLVLLLEHCKQKIKEEFGIILEEEWKIV